MDKISKITVENHTLTIGVSEGIREKIKFMKITEGQLSSVAAKVFMRSDTGKINAIDEKLNIFLTMDRRVGEIEIMDIYPVDFKINGLDIIKV